MVLQRSVTKEVTFSSALLCSFNSVPIRRQMEGSDGSWLRAWEARRIEATDYIGKPERLAWREMNVPE